MAAASPSSISSRSFTEELVSETEASEGSSASDSDSRRRLPFVGVVAALLWVVALAGLVALAIVQLRQRGGVSLGGAWQGDAVTLGTARGAQGEGKDDADCWGPCFQKAGWCQWCGSGMACCRAGHVGDPMECRGYGGNNHHQCVRVPASQNAQCGGHSWSGPTSCVPGYACIDVNSSYSQCQFTQALSDCVKPYEQCSGMEGDTPWAQCCPAGYSCRAVRKGEVEKCYPTLLQHLGKSCLGKCYGLTGACDWCGAGFACCVKGQNDPPECVGITNFTTAADECVKPVKEVTLLHNAQDCYEPCGSVGGACDWCGEGKACCRKGAHHDPPECASVTNFSSADHHVCVEPPETAPVFHEGQDCWKACGHRAGFCSWCGVGNACCRMDSKRDPAECDGAINESLPFHSCVRGVPGRNGVSLGISDEAADVTYDAYRLGINGKVNGVAGMGIHLGEAHQNGATAVRTWSIDATVGALAEARKHGMKVVAGLYVTTFKDKYQGGYCLLTNKWWKAELKKIIANVTQYKDDPALLWWLVGNEVELEISWERGSECMWQRIEWIVKHVKRADPNHPVGTAIAGYDFRKVSQVNLWCPSLDFLGLNLYAGDAHRMNWKLSMAFWNRPYAITEYANAGSWMVPRAPWGAPAEPTSTQKAMTYKMINTWCVEDKRCLGTFAFLWGNKWEVTQTWFSIFNGWHAGGVDEASSDIVATLHESWTGTGTDETWPEIASLQVWGPDGPQAPGLGFTVAQGAAVRVSIQASHFSGDGRRGEVKWALSKDVTDPAQAHSSFPAILDKVEICGEGLTGILDTSNLTAGQNYRLYAYVRTIPEDLGAGDTPLGCENPASDSKCDESVKWVQVHGTNEHPDWYPTLTPASSYREVQQFLHDQSDGKDCPLPCDRRPGVKVATASIALKVCEDAPAGSPCATAVDQAMHISIHESPEDFPGLTPSSSFREFQGLLHNRSLGECPAPCDECEDAVQGSQCEGCIRGKLPAMTEVLESPYAGVNMWSDYQALQSVLEVYGRCNCPKPCVKALPSSVQGSCPSE